MITPLHGKVLILLDPAKPSESGLVKAQEDYIDICKRCGMRLEELGRNACVGRDIMELDPIHDTYIFRGIDYSHERERITRPAGGSGAHPATILVSSSPQFERGDRVLVDFNSGESVPPDDGMSPVRIIDAMEQVLARLEEGE